MAKKATNWKELLRMFCANDEREFRAWIAKPFLNKTYNEIWATDGHALLMVKPELCGGMYDELEKPLGCTCKTRSWEDGQVVTLQEIEDALDRCPKEEEMEIDREVKDCPECGGSGNVKWEYTASHGDQRFYKAEFDCPVCDGSGIEEEEHSHPTGRMVLTAGAAVRIGNVMFRGLQMERIVKAAGMLNVTEVRILHLPKPGDFHNNCMVLAFTPDVRLLLMPFFASEEEDIATLPVTFKED